MKLRFQITKEKEIRFISHLEYLRTIGRAFRRAGLPVAYSQGFNPHMKYSLASALGVGVVSYAEFVELELTEPVNPLAAANAFRKALPGGIRVLAVDAVENQAPALMSVAGGAEYRVTLPWQGAIASAIDEFNQASSVVYVKQAPKTKAKVKEINVKEYVPFLEAYTKALGNNEYYEQVLRVVTLLDNCPLKVLPLDGQKWYEIDDVQDLDIAETIFSDEDRQLPLYQKRYGGYWRFPNLLDFCYLVNPYFPSQKLKEELKANFDVLLSEYPSGMRINSLLISKYFHIDKNYAVVGNGAAELIKSLMRYLDGKVGVVFPTFEEYPNRYAENRLVKYVPQNADFTYSAFDLQTFFAGKSISTLLLINPDNPSGNFIPYADLLSLISWTEECGIRLVVDESFVDFSVGYEQNTLLRNDILSRYPHLTVMKSISKSYGVPGLRLGVLASADKELIEWMRKDVAIWNINSFAEFYMQIFGKYEDDYRRASRLFVEERARFQKELSTISWLRVIPSQANYFLCEVLDKYSSKDLLKLLLIKYGVLIKDCSTKSGFEGKNYIRIAVRGKADNDKLVESLKKL